ncbi:hypothetical protein GCM10009765_57200 [Fodinicola feengrottensis]|uniref:DUF624 domain-containing protein n=1 Tax=Fodinicola feengrottensis TaxID=435914 RepID=A0ABN2I891_9ACTN
MTGWKEVVRAGTDLAIIGFAVLALSLPVLTAGAALAAGSAAVHHWCEHGDLPPARLAGRWFVGALLPGLGAQTWAAVVTAILVADVRALLAGHVPGGTALVLITVLVATYAIGVAALTVVQVGRTQARGWWAALRASVRPQRGSAAATAALSAVVGIAVVLAAALPATTPLVVAFALFAGHVTVRRLRRDR